MSCSNDSDPHIWLEEIDSDRALRWAEQRNQNARSRYASKESFLQLKDRLETAFNSDDRIPYVAKYGNWYYNFWQDEKNPRGIWRRTNWERYASPETTWETVLDIDELNRRESANWVYSGAQLLYPDWKRALVSLSRGGSDATVIREFDLIAMEFVKDGFTLPESKGSVSWAGFDRLFVARDFGEGTMTESGYPRTVRVWHRGEALESARTIYEGHENDVGVSAYAILDKDYEKELVIQGTDFYNSKLFLMRNSELIEIEKPSDAAVDFHREHMFLSLDSDWQVEDGKTFAAGSLLVIPFEAFLAGDRNFTALFSPAPNRALLGYSQTRNSVLIRSLEDVRHRVDIATQIDGAWQLKRFDLESGFDVVSIWPIDARESNEYFLVRAGFTNPSALFVGEVDGGEPRPVKSMPAYFDASGIEVSQHWARSKDGTEVPYFQVGKPQDGTPRPTLLYGYGGFQASMLPSYSATIGAGWLERGGTYILANIRGGGEYGPAWHQAALKENRNRAYEDFIAVAEDLIERNVSTHRTLGIQGGSNGGLLMGNMLTMRPDLFGAIVAQVPLFDMQRYHLLLAGASWIAEYGDPDKPEEWEYLKAFSPYHNLKRDVSYPNILIMTSTRDDRVHPGHARKMVAKLESYGQDVTYFENMEGGHAGAADNAQRAFMWTLSMEFLWQTLHSEER